VLPVSCLVEVVNFGSLGAASMPVAGSSRLHASCSASLLPVLDVELSVLTLKDSSSGSQKVTRCQQATAGFTYV